MIWQLFQSNLGWRGVTRSEEAVIMRGRGRGRGEQGGSRGEGAEGRSVHQRLGQLATWSSPARGRGRDEGQEAGTPLQVQGTFDKTRLGEQKEEDRRRRARVRGRSQEPSASREASSGSRRLPGGPSSSRTVRKQSRSPVRKQEVSLRVRSTERAGARRRSPSPHFSSRRVVDRSRSPLRLQVSPPRHRGSSPRYSPDFRSPRLGIHSPPRHELGFLSPPRRGPSRGFSPGPRRVSPGLRRVSPNPHRYSSPQRHISPLRRFSPPRHMPRGRNLSPERRHSPQNHFSSRRPASPTRHLSPLQHLYPPRLHSPPRLRSRSPLTIRMGEGRPHRGSPPRFNYSPKLGSPQRAFSPPIGSRLGSPPRFQRSPSWRHESSLLRRGRSPKTEHSPQRRGHSSPRRGHSSQKERSPRMEQSQQSRGQSFHRGHPSVRGHSPPRRGHPSSKRRSPRQGRSPPRRGHPLVRGRSSKRGRSPKRGHSPLRRGHSPSIRGQSTQEIGLFPPQGDAPRNLSPQYGRPNNSQIKANSPRKSPNRKNHSLERRHNSPPRRSNSQPRRFDSSSSHRGRSTHGREEPGNGSFGLDHGHNFRNISERPLRSNKDLPGPTDWRREDRSMSPRQVVVSDRNISVTKHFASAPREVPNILPTESRGREPREAPHTATSGSWGREDVSSGSPTTSKRTGRPPALEPWGQSAPPPPRISGETLAPGRLAPPAPQDMAPLHRVSGKSLLNHFCEQAALSGQPLTKVAS